MVLFVVTVCPQHSSEMRRPRFHGGSTQACDRSAVAFLPITEWNSPPGSAGDLWQLLGILSDRNYLHNIREMFFHPCSALSGEHEFKHVSAWRHVDLGHAPVSEKPERWIKIMRLVSTEVEKLEGSSEAGAAMEG